MPPKRKPLVGRSTLDDFLGRVGTSPGSPFSIPEPLVTPSVVTPPFTAGEEVGQRRLIDLVREQGIAPFEMPPGPIEPYSTGGSEVRAFHQNAETEAEIPQPTYAQRRQNPEFVGPQMPTPLENMQGIYNRDYLNPRPPTLKQALLKAGIEAAPVALGAIFGGEAGAAGAAGGVQRANEQEQAFQEQRRKDLMEQIEAERSRQERLAAANKPFGVAPEGAVFDPITRQMIFRNEPRTPAPRNIDPNSPEGIAARLEFEQKKPQPLRNIDPLSPEGIAAQAELAKQKPPTPRNIDPNSPEGIQARLEFERKKPRTEPTVVIQTTDEQGNKVSRIVPKTPGSSYAGAPTSQEQNAAASLKKAGPVLDQIAALSEKINTQQGALAKITGAEEKAKARLNLNDDVATYEALISGFTPLVARALGHSGVLTEQDVQTVRRLFPDPTDSKSLRDRKMAQIRNLLGGGGGAVMMRAPNGQVKPVPADQVDHYKNLGAVVVQ